MIVDDDFSMTHLREQVWRYEVQPCNTTIVVVKWCARSAFAYTSIEDIRRAASGGFDYFYRPGSTRRHETLEAAQRCAEGLVADLEGRTC